MGVVSLISAELFMQDRHGGGCHTVLLWFASERGTPNCTGRGVHLLGLTLDFRLSAEAVGRK